MRLRRDLPGVSTLLFEARGTVDALDSVAQRGTEGGMTASVIADTRWGYAAILLTRPGYPKRMLANVVINDDDVPGISAADLAEEFIQYMEDPRNGYTVDTWNEKAWAHDECYREFVRRWHVWEAA